MFSKNKSIPDAECDIEHLPIVAIERADAALTVFMMSGDACDIEVRCSDVKHADFVRRFREKIRTA